jgi:hypothetical protein
MSEDIFNKLPFTARKEGNKLIVEAKPPKSLLKRIFCSKKELPIITLHLWDLEDVKRLQNIKISKKPKRREH